MNQLKGNQVVIKRLQLTKLDLTKDLLVELKVVNYNLKHIETILTSLFKDARNISRQSGSFCWPVC